jgi:hypothetical protein
MILAEFLLFYSLHSHIHSCIHSHTYIVMCSGGKLCEFYPIDPVCFHFRCNTTKSITTTVKGDAATFVDTNAKNSQKQQQAAGFTPLLAGLSSSISSFSSCIFTASTANQVSKKNPEQSLAQLHRFLDSKIVKSTISIFNVDK